MDVEILARMQFAFTIAFHFIYPPLSIGLGLFLVLIEGAYLKTKNIRYKNMAKFWVKVFSLTFAMGVATGLVQVFEFGTNWATFSRYVGDVFGAALGAEGIFAFMLEAGFLSILLFGWNRVGPKTHFFATCMVALGAHFSAVWILVANSWMQTPAGFHIVGEGLAARAEITSFWQMVFNPSSIDRIWHTVVACWITGAFLVMSICAYYLWKQRHVRFARTSMKVGIAIAFIGLIVQGISGDSTARGVTENQPTKLAAMEGVYKTQAGAGAYVFGWVDNETQQVWGLAIPKLLSFLCYRNFNATVTGLDAFPQDEWPNVSAVFQTYHVMLYMWGAMFFTALLAWIFYKRIKVGRAKPLLWLMMISVVFPQIANIAGWFTAEMGRQPWIVWGQLRTSDALSEAVSAGQVLGSIIMFFVLYVSLFALFIWLLDNKIKHGPEEEEETNAQPVGV